MGESLRHGHVQIPGSEGKVLYTPPELQSQLMLEGQAWSQKQAQTLNYCFSINCSSTKLLRQCGFYPGLQMSMKQPSAGRVDIMEGLHEL